MKVSKTVLGQPAPVSFPKIIAPRRVAFSMPHPRRAPFEDTRVGAATPHGAMLGFRPTKKVRGQILGLGPNPEPGRSGASEKLRGGDKEIVAVTSGTEVAT